MSTGAVIAAIVWALIVIALIAILSAEARRRRHDARRRESALRLEAIPRTGQVEGAPARDDRSVAVDSDSRSARERAAGERAA